MHTRETVASAIIVRLVELHALKLTISPPTDSNPTANKIYYYYYYYIQKNSLCIKYVFKSQKCHRKCPCHEKLY